MLQKFEPDKEYQKRLNTNLGCLILNIKLGPTFPSDDPVIQVHSLIKHRWVDATGKIKIHDLGLSNLIKIIL